MMDLLIDEGAAPTRRPVRASIAISFCSGRFDPIDRGIDSFAKRGRWIKSELACAIVRIDHLPAIARAGASLVTNVEPDGALDIGQFGLQARLAARDLPQRRPLSS